MLLKILGTSDHLSISTRYLRIKLLFTV